jgi:hypothetical protein
MSGRGKGPNDHVACKRARWGLEPSAEHSDSEDEWDTGGYARVKAKLHQPTYMRARSKDLYGPKDWEDINEILHKLNNLRVPWAADVKTRLLTRISGSRDGIFRPADLNLVVVKQNPRVIKVLLVSKEFIF